MREIKIHKDVVTEFWILTIDGKETIKSKHLLRVAKNFYKFVKGQGEQ